MLSHRRAGLVGCAISTLLADHFDTVVAVDNLHPQIHERASRPLALDARVKLVIGDITNEEVWSEILAQGAYDVVVHLAAETGTGQSLTEATRHANVNVVGTTRMLDAFVRHGAMPDRIVLSSSRAVYGEGAWKDNATGTVSYPGQRPRKMLEEKLWDFDGKSSLSFDARYTEPRPISIYGATKLAQEHILRCWTQSYGTDLAILRLQNVYGPGQSLTNSYTGIVPLFARVAKGGGAIPVFEDGAITRDFVFIEDVASAISLSAINGGTSYVPIDVGSGMTTSILELAKLISSIYGAPTPRVNGLYREGDVRHASCNIETARQELTWEPRTSLGDGLMKLCAWLDGSALSRAHI